MTTDQTPYPFGEDITVVITTHGTQALKELPVILGTLQNQKYYSPGQHSRDAKRQVLYVSGKPLDRLEYPTEIIVMSDGLLGQDGPNLLTKCKTVCDVIETSDGMLSVKLRENFKSFYLAESVDLFLECPPDPKAKVNVGHHTRDYGINSVTSEWVTLTNSDNLFFAGWRHRISNALIPQHGLVYWNCVNNLWKWGMLPGGSKIQRGLIDLSCAAVRTSIAKKVGFKGRDYDSDYDYIQACADEASIQDLKIIHLNECLVVHQ